MFLLGKRRRGHGLGLVGGLGARRHPVDPRNAQAVCLGSPDWFLFGIQNALVKLALAVAEAGVLVLRARLVLQSHLRTACTFHLLLSHDGSAEPAVCRVFLWRLQQAVRVLSRRALGRKQKEFVRVADPDGRGDARIRVLRLLGAADWPRNLAALGSDLLRGGGTLAFAD